MKLPFPRSFKAWLVALVSLTAVTLVSIAPMTRPRAQSPPTAYTITDLGTLGGVESKAFALNSCGQVAGYATNAGNSKRPFFRPSNSLIDLGVLSGDGTATSVNNSGQVVGYSPVGASNRAFIWHDDNGNSANDPGEMKELLPIGAIGSAEDINDNGRVVGWIESAGGSGGTGGYAGFVWENNNFQLISGSPAHNSTKVYGINNAGTMVGEDSDLLQGFILRNGTFTDIPAFGTGIKSVAYAVSESDHVVGASALNNIGTPTMHAIVWTDVPGLKDLGTLAGKTHSIAYNVAIVSGSVQVVGTSYNIESDAQAFVWQDLDADGEGINDPTEMKDLLSLVSNPTGWTRLSEARSINSSGQIVGFGVMNGETHAFLLTPPSVIPSPCLPTVSVSVSPASMNEDAAGFLTYTFTRSIVTASQLTVNFSVGGTADASNDYGLTATSFTPLTGTGTVTFASGSATATVTVDPAIDSVVEPNETVVLTTSPDAAYTVAAAPLNAATGTINNDDLANVSVAVSPAATAEDGSTDLIYTFTRNSTIGSLTVNFSVDGTATFSTDYAQSGATTFGASSGTVTFSAGNSTATVTLNPATDSAVETDETAVLTVTSGIGYTIGSPSVATGTITNDDFPNVSVAVSPASVAEDGSTNLVYTFTRSSTIGSPTVNFSVGGTATFSSDYAQSGAATFGATSGTVTFSAGALTATVTIDPTTDSAVEVDETAILTVTSGTGYTVGSPSVATGTISNDDTNVSVAVSPASVAEDGSTDLVYTFTRTGVTTGALTVTFSVGGTATFSTDYAQSGAATFGATSGTVTFSAGALTATVTLNPTPDSTVETDETAILTVTSGTGYTVGSPSVATGTITNDDTNVSVAVSPASVAEDGPTDLVYTFTRTGVASGPLTVNFSVGGTADASTDYVQTGAASFTPPTGSVSFASGDTVKQITVNPTPDTTVEPDETVVLTVTSGVGYTIGIPSGATGTITNDDSIPSVSVAVSPLAVTEDGAPNLVYTFTRNSTSGSLTVNFSVGGTAGASDYVQTGAASFTPSTGSVSFASGETVKQITVDPTPDSEVESDETVILTVTTGTGYTVGSPSVATGTITNDDTDVTVTLSPASVTESGAATLVYTFSRTGVTTGALTVNFSVGGTATLSDYSQTGAATFSASAGTVTLPAGISFATVSLNPTPDPDVESAETVTLTVTSGTGYNVVSPSAATGTITDAPFIYVEEGTENSPTPTAAAVDSVTFVRGPFQLINNNNLSNDQPSATRIIIFTSNLGMTNANLASGMLTVRFNSSAIPLANIEHVGPVGLLSGSYIIVKLPALPTGPNTLTVTLGGVESNATTLSIIPNP